MMAKQFCKMSLYITCKKSIHKCKESVPVGSFDIKMNVPNVE